MKRKQYLGVQYIGNGMHVQFLHCLKACVLNIAHGGLMEFMVSIHQTQCQTFTYPEEKVWTANWIKLINNLWWKPVCCWYTICLVSIGFKCWMVVQTGSYYCLTFWPFYCLEWGLTFDCLNCVGVYFIHGCMHFLSVILSGSF